MKLKTLDIPFSVCKVERLDEVFLQQPFCFVGKTDEEISLVCETAKAPQRCVAREDGWRAFRIEGVLDFSLIGILARISAVLAAEKVGIFVISTFNTDYVLVKEKDFARALSALKEDGYKVL